MDPVKLIEKYYKKNGAAYRYLKEHNESVAKKALEIVKNMNDPSVVDITFIKEAALLHDIGVRFTHAPHIGCFGKDSYIMHGVIGRKILEKEGFKEHALVCERHIGVGITAKEVRENDLPLPERDMVPLTKEEEIVSLADNFFSKSNSDLSREESIEEMEQEAKKYGEEKLKKLREWMSKYNILA